MAITLYRIICEVHRYRKIQDIFEKNINHAKSIRNDQDTQAYAESMAYFGQRDRLTRLAGKNYKFKKGDNFEIYEALLEWAKWHHIAQCNPDRMIADNDWHCSDAPSEIMSKLHEAEGRLFDLVEKDTKKEMDKENKRYTKKLERARKQREACGG